MPTIKGHGRHVLFIDDDVCIVNIVREILTGAGFQVSTETNPKKGIEIYAENPQGIDLVLLDMVMPDLDGAAVFEAIKQIDPQVRVLLTSGYALTRRASAILEKGCQGFIQKPFKPKDLVAKIQGILET